MLESLSIKNLALIKDQTIEFKKGLNVILGETGSGKSLIFDAINFVTGLKTDKSLLRTGESVMKVEALFSDLSSFAKQSLKDYDIIGDEILLSRTLNEEGKSSFRINGQPVVAGMVKAISKTLLDSLQQHEGMELLKSKNHLNLLDKFGGDEINDLKINLAQAYTLKKEIEKNILSLGGSDAERDRLKELLAFQIGEIEKCDLQPGEDEEIKAKLEMMSSAEKIVEVTSLADKNLSSSNYSVLSLMSEVIDALASLSKIDILSENYDRLTSLRYDIEDIADSLTKFSRSVSFDEIEFNKLDSRLDQIKLLKKKYGGTVEEVLSYCDKLKQRLEELEASQENIERLQKELSKQEKSLYEIATKLTNKRKEVALLIEQRVCKELFDLGMKNTIFKVKFEEKKISPDGKDEVVFVFSANKGQELKNLSQTASGGEVSRIMLALKNIFTSVDEIGVLLFDEVDSGISGEVGNMVAKKLYNISKQTQVLCVSHLSQVAGLADSFLLVNKKVLNDETLTEVISITEEKGIEQIAKLIGGENITDVALSHAKEIRARKDELE